MQSRIVHCRAVHCIAVQCSAVQCTVTPEGLFLMIRSGGRAGLTTLNMGSCTLQCREICLFLYPAESWSLHSLPCGDMEHFNLRPAKSRRHNFRGQNNHKNYLKPICLKSYICKPLLNRPCVAGTVLQTALSLINWLSESSFVKISSKHRFSN